MRIVNEARGNVTGGNMSKFIVFCADGTWNGPGQPEPAGEGSSITNVLKVYRMLAGIPSTPDADFACEQEKVLTDSQGRAVQVAKYIDGVGDSTNWLVHTVGGDFGAGMIVRIVRGYTFVSRNYEPGDKIVLLGFSRGAYTARALGGLIAGQGLLDRRKLDLSDKNQAYQWGCSAWRTYRATTCGNKGFFQKLAEDVPTLDALLTHPPQASDYLAAPIEAIAVWDTVGSLGIPDIQGGVNLDLFQFVNCALANSVRHGFHAVSADERRGNFTPTLWEKDQRVLQVLFPGAHADVGGGYPSENNESGLSDCALQWMSEKLRELGVVVGPPTAPFRPDAAGVAHAPWRDMPWRALPSGPRMLRAGLTVSQSLADRLALQEVIDYPGAAAAPYAPTALGAYMTGRTLDPSVQIVRT